jgi:hypothetical protein
LSESAPIDLVMMFLRKDYRLLKAALFVFFIIIRFGSEGELILRDADDLAVLIQ